VHLNSTGSTHLENCALALCMEAQVDCSAILLQSNIVPPFDFTIRRMPLALLLEGHSTHLCFNSYSTLRDYRSNTTWSSVTEISHRQIWKVSAGVKIRTSLGHRNTMPTRLPLCLRPSDAHRTHDSTMSRSDRCISKYIYFVLRTTGWLLYENMKELNVSRIKS
jgi:hypothetical protein